MDTSKNGSGRKEHTPKQFIHYLKLAAAVAIIRNKPPGQSGEEFASELADQYYGEQLSLQTKLQDLEEQVLLLKQQQILQQQHQGRTDVTDSEPVFPTPPCSAPSVDHYTAPSASHLSQHTAFLSSMLTLKSLSNTSTCAQYKGMVKQTLSTALRNIKRVLLIDGDCSISATVLNHTVDVIAHVPAVWKNTDGEDLVDVIETFVREIISHLAQEDWETKGGHPLVIGRLLTSMCKSSSLSPVVLTGLVSSILSCSDTLRNVKIGQQELQPHTFENLGHIFGVLEQCIDETQHRKTTTKLPQSIRADLTCGLENSLLHLCEEFPLFAHQIWKIIGCLASTEQN